MMIPHNEVTEGFYWATLIKGNAKVIVVVYGCSPFFRVDLWDPALGRGTRINDLDINEKPVEFIEKIEGI